MFLLCYQDLHEREIADFKMKIHSYESEVIQTNLFYTEAASFGSSCNAGNLKDTIFLMVLGTSRKVLKIESFLQFGTELFTLEGYEKKAKP